MDKEMKELLEENNISNNEAIITDLPEKETEDLDPNYATKKELNTESTIRARDDQKIINELKMLKIEQDSKINKITCELEAEKQEIKIIQTKVTTSENNIKDNETRIVALEECCYERINQLKDENEQLNSQLAETKEKLNEKEAEIAKLREEIENNNDQNHINLRFADVPEFKVNEIISVSKFIDSQLKDLVVKRMEVRYPGTEWNKDYHILIDGLDNNDVMQGKKLLAIVRANLEGKLLGESGFEIEVNYDYDQKQQEKFLEAFLTPTIPVSLRNVPEDATPDYNVPKEIANTKPLKLLLNNKTFNYLSFKIFAEMNAASYWTDFHRTWQFIKNDYVGTGQSVIGGSTIINNVNNLAYNNSGYYHNLFKIIEQQINDSGVPCTIYKRWLKSNRGVLLHTLGNLTFNGDNNVKKRYYYIMVNFELVRKDGAGKFYRGVTLALSNNLELY